MRAGIETIYAFPTLCLLWNDISEHPRTSVFQYVKTDSLWAR